MSEQPQFDHLCQQVTSTLTAVGLKREDLLATLPAARKRVYARRYGKEPAENAGSQSSSDHRGK